MFVTGMIKGNVSKYGPSVYERRRSELAVPDCSSKLAWHLREWT
jgi:hypothetical protein